MQSIPRLAFLVVAVFMSRELAAESLGAAAKREKERRARNKEAGVTARVIDPSEIGIYQGPAEDKKTGKESSSSQAPASPGPKDKSSSSGNDESAWRARKAAARDRVARAQKELDDAMAQPLKQGVGESRTHPRDPGRIDFYPDTEAAAHNQKIFDRRKRAEADLQKAREAEAQLDEDARRAGALPGWLR